MDNNIKTIAQYIANGETPQNRIGLEIEHFIVYKGSAKSVPYFNGVDKVLERLSRYFEQRTYSDGFLIALFNDRYHLTLEPAAQLEISIMPVNSIREAADIYDDFISLLNPILDEFGYELCMKGYLPKSRVDDLPIIPKKRYQFMEQYFKTTGTCGKHMMKGTASTQISIDYSSERDCAEKFRLANILSPVFSMICDNSSIFDGHSYSGRMLRSYIWDNVDVQRSGIVPCALDSDFGYEKYAKYIYNSPAILIEKDGDSVYTGNEKISSIYNEKNLSSDETEHLLSMFFPDVRLKQYIEIRPADCMPIEYSLAYAAFIKGIFTDFSELHFDSVCVLDIIAAKKSLTKYGFDGIAYGENAYELSKRLYALAERNLCEDEKEFLLPLKNIIYNKTTLKETDLIGL